MAESSTPSQPLASNRETTEQQIPEQGSQLQPSSLNGLVLHVDFAWTKFRNTISEKNGETVTPRYVQHFRATKPQLRFNSADDSTQIGSGVFNNVSISGECVVNGRFIELKPLKRWKAKYNYLSNAFAPPSDPKSLVPITWIANSGLKTWDFVCLDANQLPIAQFSTNWWALKKVGKFCFEKSGEDLKEEQRDEVVITGLTLMYIMAARINNPFSLVGSVFAKPGKVEP